MPRQQVSPLSPRVFSEGLEGTRLVPCSRECEGARSPLRNLPPLVQKSPPEEAFQPQAVTQTYP
ncbi:MAG: hypothetical protein AAF268_03680 [Cyanobacteria bacterium P01_A01_bin.3]